MVFRKPKLLRYAPSARGRHLATLWRTLLLAVLSGSSHAADNLLVTSLFNGERSGFLNHWGGPFGQGNIHSIGLSADVTRTGDGSIEANLGSLPTGGFAFFQTFSSALGPSNLYRQDRNLMRYESLEGHLRNDTGAPFTLTLELKDYRDSLNHVAKRSYTIPAGSDWIPISAPLDLSSGWSIAGSPDLERAFAISILVNANLGSPVSGSIYLDDFNLVERGSPIDLDTAPLNAIVERMAQRQFDGLWTARNRLTGIIPNRSDDVVTGALNTTAGVVWMLPSAVRRNWITQPEADAYMGQVVNSISANRDQTTYLPSRFLDLVTGAPRGDGEKSSIDASFLALALHNYKSHPATPSELHDAIDALQNRFDLASFASADGFKLAYLPSSGFTPFHYNRYTHEGKIVSLSAELSSAYHVPLESTWNQDTFRVLDSLVNPEDSHLVATEATFRAPFEQALINLFIDTSERGADNYPNRALARNPRQNFERYEREVGAKLEQLGRDLLYQPDAGGVPAGYHQYSLYNDFGQPNLIMPWSAALALMAGAETADEAIRFLLDHDLHGPLGFSDSAQWATGALEPDEIPAFQDNWNLVLSTMALLEYLEGPQRASLRFANLPEVKSALDAVFVAGDYDGNGIVTDADYLFWREHFGSKTLLAADGNNGGSIDAADYTVWRDHLAVGSGSELHASVPEPNAIGLSFAALLLTACARRTRWNLSQQVAPQRNLLMALL